MGRDYAALIFGASIPLERGIKTKRAPSLWRGTSVRAIIDNPIYIGIYRMHGAESEPSSI